jgi:hypothetical protein
MQPGWQSLEAHPEGIPAIISCDSRHGGQTQRLRGCSDHITQTACHVIGSLSLDPPACQGDYNAQGLTVAA